MTRDLISAQIDEPPPPALPIGVHLLAVSIPAPDQQGATENTEPKAWNLPELTGPLPLL